jgi:transcriptional regulator with XRE-family HTH domain
MSAPRDPWNAQVEALGRFIHAQRKLAKLSLRELASLSELSNAYLSQLERGLHEPSIRVIRQLARALGVPTETLLAQAGVMADDRPVTDTDAVTAADAGGAEAAIRSDPSLSAAQREALLAVLRSFRPGPDSAPDGTSAGS